jgi:hypothetical protein
MWILIALGTFVSAVVVGHMAHAQNRTAEAWRRVAGMVGLLSLLTLYLYWDRLLRLVLAP